jgi:alpha-N-arabinofuranosidase
MSLLATHAQRNAAKDNQMKAVQRVSLLAAATLLVYSVPVSAQNNIIRVNAQQIIRTVPKTVTGANIEWIWNGNSMFDPNTGQNRPELVAPTKALQPGVLRFPGGALADYYHWRDGIGPQANRPIVPHGMDGDSSPSIFGTHEFMQLCRDSGAQPLLQVNVITGTASEAASWVRYANSRFNFERILNGSAAPFNVKYWEIGNEQWIGGPGLLPVEEYARRFKQYAAAMRAVDRTIRVGAVTGMNFGSYYLVDDPEWNRKLLQAAGNSIDFLSVHNGYAPLVIDPTGLGFNDVYGALLAYPRLVEQNLNEYDREIRTYAPAKANSMTIAVTEWGPLFHFLPDSPWVDHPKTMGSGVYTASMLRTFLLAPRVEMSAFFKLVEPSFLGLMFWDGVPKPSYYVQQMFAARFGGTRVVKTDVSSPTYNSQAAGLVAAVENVPYLEAVSGLSTNGTKLHVIVINKHLSSALTAKLEVGGFRFNPTMKKTVIGTGSADAHNGNDLLQFPGITWADQITAPENSQWQLVAPGFVVPQESSGSVPSDGMMTFPPVSVTALEFTRQ